MASFYNSWRSVVLYVILIGITRQGQSVKIDSLGRKFVFAPPTPYKPSSVSGTYRPTFYVIVSTPSKQSVSGTFNCPGVAWNIGFTSSFSQPANITVSATDYLGYSFTTQPKPMIVECDSDVAVHVFYAYSNFNSEWLIGSTNVMPIDSLGNKYFIASYTPYSTRKSEFTITSLDNETTVEIQARDGERYREVLAPFSTYQLQSTNDLTGSMIQADRPVSVMSGSSCSKVPVDKDRCNYLLVHLTDVESAGTEFILSPFRDRDTGYIFRVIATVDNTIVRMYPGNHTVEIHAGEFHERNVQDVTVWYVTSTAAVLVFQYGEGGDSGNDQGDPLMVVVPAIDHFVQEITFPVVYLPTRRPSRYSMSIITQCQYVDGILLDGEQLAPRQNNVLVSHGSNFCATMAPITLGTHTISHTSTQALLSVLIHAISYKIGYAYQAGYNVKASQIISTSADTTFLIPDYLGDDGLSLLCKETQMVVFINKTMIIDGKASDVHFNDPSCVGQSVNGWEIIQVVAGNTECGTVIEETDSGSRFTNHLRYEGPRERGAIMRDPTFNIPVTCTENNLHLVSLALSPQAKHINDTLEGKEKLLNVTYEFKMYRNRKYNEAYKEDEFPVSVQLGQPLYFESSASGAADLQILTKRCVTTETNDALSTPNYIFVDDGCAPDPTIQFYETNDAAMQRFSVLTFGFFPDKEKAEQGLKNTAYVHCWLLVCNSSDSSSRCIQDCTDKSKRETTRQSAKDQLGSKQIRISQGPIVLLPAESKGASSSRSAIAPTLGGTLSVFGVVCIILLVAAILKAKRKRGSFTLEAAPEGDTVQLIDISPPTSPL